MRHTRFVWFIGIAILLSAFVASAQHTLAAKFDLTKPQTLKGIVTQIDWSNPYVHVLMKVPGSPRPVLWAVELDGSITLGRNGWSQANLPIGQRALQAAVDEDVTDQASVNATLVIGADPIDPLRGNGRIGPHKN